MKGNIVIKIGGSLLFTKNNEIDWSKVSPKAMREMLIAAGRVQALPGEVVEVNKDDNK